MELSYPVVLIVFNRSDLAREVIQVIRMVSPARIYIIADGPRLDRSNEIFECNATRIAVESAVDWPCDVRKIYSDINLGCRRRIVSGLDEVFRHEDAAIILEDDTVPCLDFFYYCSKMLAAHATDPEIISITGTNLFSEIYPKRTPFLSRYTHIWGWATWRRTWLQYRQECDYDIIDQMDEMLSSKLRKRHVSYWLEKFAAVRAGKIDTWDYQLQALAFLLDLKCITPPVNLVKNIGFRSDATHTVKQSAFADLPISRLDSLETKIAGVDRIHDWMFQVFFHNPSWVLLKCSSVIARLRKIGGCL